MSKIIKILITSGTFYQEQDAFQVITNAGFEAITIDPKCIENIREEDVIHLIQENEDISGLIVGAKYPITEKLFTASKCLRALSLNCAGYSHVDLNSATEQSVKVSNVSGLSYESIADFIWGQILNIVRNISKADQKTRQGKWNHGVERSESVSGGTIGIIGMGSLGQAVAKRALGFDMKILSNVRKPSDELAHKYNITFVSKDELYEQSDIIVLCCPLTKDTINLINKDALGKMKKKAYIINSSRGKLINENDLYDALLNNEIGGAALDVFEQEPLYQSKLMELDNVIITPHIAGLTARQIHDVAVASAVNVVKFLNNEQVDSCLNPF